MSEPDLAALVAEMELGPPATGEEIEQAEQALGRRLPAGYVAFMLRFGPGEGGVGEEGYARLVPVRDLPATQEQHDRLDQLRAWTVFGGNGGGEAYVFDDRGDVLVVPYIGDGRDAIPQGSFDRFLRRCAAGTMFERS